MLLRHSQKTRKEFEHRAIKYKNMWLENILMHMHLCHGSTQLEYSSQKMAQQIRE